MAIKAVFFDRDGTVIKEKPGTYLSDPKGVKLYKNTLKGLKLFADMGYKLFIVSNQSGIGRGYFTDKEVKAVNDHMLKILKPIKIEDIAYCPHAPSEPCNCRKPAPALGERLIKKYNIDASQSFMVGDKKSDILFGQNLNMQSILVLTANGKKQLAKYKDIIKAKVTTDLYGAAKYVQSLQKGADESK